MAAKQQRKSLSALLFNWPFRRHKQEMPGLREIALSASASMYLLFISACAGSEDRETQEKRTEAGRFSNLP